MAEGLPREIVPALRREQLAQPTNFENLFDAAVRELREPEHTMTCQIAGTSIHLEDAAGSASGRLRSTSLEFAPTKSSLCVRSPPAIVGTCNVIQWAHNAA